MIAVRHASTVPPGRAVTSARSTRKVAIFGAHKPSLIDAPWYDDTWERWGHASSRLWGAREMDLYFDLHPKACWTLDGKRNPYYAKWLVKNTVPIYMQQKYPEVPASIEYPKRRILQEFGDSRPYFTNHVAWMIALAFTMDVTTIGLFGVNYAIQSEYVMQRASCEYWLGRAQERGLKIVLPAQCSLLREPAALYGYESHDEVTGLLKEAYKSKKWPQSDDIRPGLTSIRAEPTPDIAEEIQREEAEYPRPDWALGPLPAKPNGKPAEGVA